MSKVITVMGSARSMKVPDSPAMHRDYLAEGLKNLGVDVVISGSGRSDTKHVACWGWRIGRELRAQGHDVLVMERGYIGDRFRHTSLGWNGLNGYASFPSYPDDGGERFAKHGGVIQPWKENKGDYALILGQVRGDASLKGMDISTWYLDRAREIKEHYGLPVYFRAHPDSARRGGYAQIDNAPNMHGELKDAIAGALFTCAFNSNSCLDSVMAGVPCLAGDKGTMVHDLCMHDYREIVRPDRESILHRIAWTQWEVSEILSGEALVKLVENIDG